jgi:dCTP deaminase
MSIKSDKWIRRMSMPPEGFLPMGSVRVAVNKVDGQWVIRENGLPVFAYDVEKIIPVDDEDVRDFKPMIEPFAPSQIRHKGGNLCEPPSDAPEPAFGEMVSYRKPLEKIVSYGTSSYGYDVRVADEFKIFTNINSTVVDPKNFDEKSFVDFKGDVCIIPPNSFALARTVEYFRIPRNVLTVCLGKSTYARCGIIVNVTPFEPEWEGFVTLEFSNTTPLPAKIYANEGVAQVLFFQSDEACATSYKDRGGKYMGQGAVPVPPKV